MKSVISRTTRRSGHNRPHSLRHLPHFCSRSSSTIGTARSYYFSTNNNCEESNQNDKRNFQQHHQQMQLQYSSLPSVNRPKNDQIMILNSQYRGYHSTTRMNLGIGPIISSRSYNFLFPQMKNFPPYINDYNCIHYSLFSTTANTNSTSNDDTKQVSTDEDSDTASNNKTAAASRKEKMQLAAKQGSESLKEGATSFRFLIQKYGYTFLGTYLSVYFITLATLFTGLDSGIIDPSSLSHLPLPWHTAGEEQQAAADAAADAEDFSTTVELLAKYMERYSWTKDYAEVVKENPHLSNLAIAWVATKFTEPVRLPVTLAILPKVKKMVDSRKIGKGGKGEKSDDMQMKREEKKNEMK